MFFTTIKSCPREPLSSWTCNFLQSVPFGPSKRTPIQRSNVATTRVTTRFGPFVVLPVGGFSNPLVLGTMTPFLRAVQVGRKPTCDMRSFVGEILEYFLAEAFGDKGDLISELSISFIWMQLDAVASEDVSTFSDVSCISFFVGSVNFSKV